MTETKQIELNIYVISTGDMKGFAKWITELTSDFSTKKGINFIVYRRYQLHQ